MRQGRAASIAANIVLTAFVTCLCLAALEAAFRLTDGYRLDRLMLEAQHSPSKPASSRVIDATQYAKNITLDPTFELAWFHTSPPDYDRSPKYEPPADWRDAVANYRPSPGERAFVKNELQFLYNYNWLVDACKTGDHANVIKYYKKYPGFVYAFVGPDASVDPPYRVVARGWDRGLDYYNNFGFRGADIAPRKLGRTIRIAFLGSSVTAGGVPFSYPEYVVHYLRLWAKANRLDVDFDLVNGARIGSNSTIIAKIMRDEVAPLHPDIVVYYEGGNDLTAGSIVRHDSEMPDGPSKLRVSFNVHSRPLEQYSAFLSRSYQLAGYGSGAEPAKPAHTLNFDLTQKTIDVERKDLPFQLNEQIADIRNAADAARSVGGEFVLASFVAMVQDGLRLDPDRHQMILKVLNDEYFPLTYREIRQSLDFENLAYRKLALIDHYPFLDIAGYFPQDPDLFEDMVHLSSPDGFRVMAWIVAQELTPYLRDAIRTGSLPKPEYDPDPQALAWANQPPIKFDLSCLP